MWSIATKVLRFDTKKALNKFFIKKSLRCCTTFRKEEIGVIQLELRNALLQYSGAVRVPCDKVVKEFFKSINAEDQIKSSFVTDIFKSCETFNLPDLSLSFYRFLKSENVKISDIHYYIILHTIKRSRSFRREKDNLIELYNDLKPQLYGYNNILIDAAASVFWGVEDFWNELKNIPGFRTSNKAATFLIAGAFNFNFPEYGWSLLKEKVVLTSEILNSYLNYCIGLAQNNKFSEEVLNDLIEFSKENCLMMNNFPVEQVKNLVKVLNNKNYAYLWSVEETTLSHHGYCSNCNSKLLDVGINEEELQLLKQHVIRDVIINKNINVKTSKKEIQNFIKFLEKNQDIDIVVDGLNMYHLLHNARKGLQIIKTLRNRGLKVLIIVKRYSRFIKEYKNIEKYCKIYETHFLSDDDIFFIYAAMHIGPKTSILTGDFLRGYGHLLKDPHLQKLFSRWQYTHQYRINKATMEIIPPPSHSLSPQVTKMNEQNYCCHIPTTLSNYNFAALASGTPSWLCIKRVSRETMREKHKKKVVIKK